MNRIIRYPTWLVAVLMLTLGSVAGGAFVGASMVQAGHAPEAAVAAAAPPVREAVTMPGSFSPVVKAVLPAVVNIFSPRMGRTSNVEGSPFGDRESKRLKSRHPGNSYAGLL